MKEGEDTLSPLDEFDLKVKELTDFGEYTKLLAQEGVPAMLDYMNPSLTPSHKSRQLKVMIAFTTARVIKNRESQGLPNTTEELFSDKNIMRKWNTELLADLNLRLQVAQGIIRGLIVTNVIEDIYAAPGGFFPLGEFSEN